ncbi:MAG: hypothetical protein NVSMB45_04000 [Ginsengibacter sp.]
MGIKELLYLIIVVEIGTEYPIRRKNDIDRNRQKRLTLLPLPFLLKNKKRINNKRYISISMENKML